MRPFFELTPSPDIQGDWSPAPATIEVNGVAAAGSLLMDTGVPSMFLRPPEDTSQVPPKPVLVPAQPVPNGTEEWTRGAKAEFSGVVPSK
ncbi:hypothetical protein [Hyalangium minutum]|uniref:Uncharacterized protein n=1 Tax=Hyalangium minutum TaxID=394096 RepID=A0A085W9R3_9BACT|nr:hypothetical protein [Hyalangium minutum]KFE64426.1 hypothetical protein DB31_2220 [Hyalangium minutum]